MKKIKYFAFLLSVKSTDVSCLVEKPEADLGNLKYVETSLKSCNEILEINDEFKDCTPAEVDGKTIYDCILNDQSGAIDDCPDPPEGENCAGEKDSIQISTEHVCQYTCTAENLPTECASDYSHELRMTSSLFCFDQNYEKCEFTTIIPKDEQKDQITQTCRLDFCGYNPTVSQSGTFKITFEDVNSDGKKDIKSTFSVTGTDVASNVFGCSGGKTSDGCSCDHTDDNTFTATETYMYCNEDFYKNQCDALTCKDNICYNGSPIMNYKFDNCMIENEDMKYCSEDEMVYLPCGDFRHECSPGTDGVDCKCFNMLDETSCKRVGGKEFTQGDSEIVPPKESECLIENININEEMMECEKMTCFNSTFFEEDCLNKNDIFISTYWQCYDDFIFYKVTSPAKAGEYNKVEKTEGSYKNLPECVENEWLEGFYECKDTASSKSENYCSSFGNYFVENKSSSSARSNIQDSFEFICLSISDKFNAVNDINSDVNAKSECFDLTARKHNESDICPDVNGCVKVEETKNDLPEHGFYECQCDNECSYQCSSSKYDPVFPVDFTDEQQKNREFTTYDCEKDNLVMIICTSIFVPLGVAGIAAGVYFFFFHESSEVAPVETDDELASKGNTEHNQSEEDKEETHSEITKEN